MRRGAGGVRPDHLLHTHYRGQHLPAASGRPGAAVHRPPAAASSPGPAIAASGTPTGQYWAQTEVRARPVHHSVPASVPARLIAGRTSEDANQRANGVPSQGADSERRMQCVRKCVRVDRVGPQSRFQCFMLQWSIDAMIGGCYFSDRCLQKPLPTDHTSYAIRSGKVRVE